MGVSHELLFELLTEEIPAWMLSERLSFLREAVAESVEEFRAEAVGDDMIIVDATSRRIVIRIARLGDRQPDRELVLKGPPANVAFAENGEPTKALEGFLRKNEAKLGDVETRENYVWLKQTVRGKTAKEFFSEELPAIIEGLRWPKMMFWGEGRTWIRPVHSVVALFDGSPIAMQIFGIESGLTTVGHRTRSAGPIEVRDYDSYIADLREASVVVRSEERTAELRRRSVELAAEIGGTPAEDESIWEQWRYLTECPGLVRAEFRKEFLALPSEVLITVMRVHQKQLPIWKDGRLTTSFLAIIDGADDPDGHAANGNAFVSNARFADALFFHDTDRKRTLESRVEDLTHLQFQEKVGNYRDKTSRIETIVDALADKANADESAIRVAARLAKTDLMTEMVKEFTDLQGQIGGIYAREEGLPENVWQAIYDHYLPRSLDDALPRTVEGALLSIADRIDTLAAFFSIGIRPTGSKDPFALRRAGQGIVQMLLARDPWLLPLSVNEIVEAGARTFDGDSLEDQLLEFLSERTRTVLEARGWAYDEVDAAMTSGWSRSLPDLEDRIRALHEIRSMPDFLSILDSAKRIANIVPEDFHGVVDVSRLEHPTEKRLAELAEQVESQIDELIAQNRYRMALESFAGMAPELERFFVDVMVMVDDELIRKNRMALLRRVGNAAGKIATVNRIVVDRKELATS